MTLPSYSSLCHIGHRSIVGIFDGPVLVQEKIDGSQISFGRRGDELFMRSKGVALDLEQPNGMFALGVEAVKRVKDRLVDGWVYRGEYLSKPKHNTLAYDRTPSNHIALFDIEDSTKGEQFFFAPEVVYTEALRLGFDATPTLHHGVIGTTAELQAMLERVSVLGGAKIEGVVVKNYEKFTADKKVMMGKLVSDEFKEIHRGEWRKSNPTQGDITAKLVAGLSTPARFAKAVQHLREAGVLNGSVSDIGNLIREVQADIKKECSDEIAAALVDHHLPTILRDVARSVPDWYKGKLLEAAA